MQNSWRWFLWIIIAIILISPAVYWSTGIGQSASGLSAEIGRTVEGVLITSPKAQARHTLILPMRLERMLIYPLLLLAFQLSGASVALRQRLDNRTRDRSLLNSVMALLNKCIPKRWHNRITGYDLLTIFLFVVVLQMGIFLLYLPFNFYQGFIVAHQFDLSNQTAAGWLIDWSKNVLINLVIDGTLWTGFYGLMRLLPRRWPIPGGALLLLVGIFLTLLTPILITPLFYNVTVLDDADLQARIMSVAERAGMPVDEIEVIDASSKTTMVNAYVTGFGQAQRIVVYDTLLRGHSPDQVEVVLAHELGHWYYKHVLLSILGMGAVTWIGLFGLRWLLNKSWQRLGLRGPADVAGMPFILAIVAVASMLALPVVNTISRYGEYQADVFALNVSQKPREAVRLFEQVAKSNLSVVRPAEWEKIMFYTHPPLVERVQLAREWRQQAQERGRQQAGP